jgi:hypothetical protein
MTRLRPVTEHWPSSATLWDDTSLPFGVVITPLSGLTKSQPNDDDDPPPPLSCIPKCLHCGAPHPVEHQGKSHDHKWRTNEILCYLCGKTTSIRYQDQSQARVAEDLPQHEYTQTVRQMHLDPVSKHVIPGISETVEFALPLYENIPSLPAHVCPPVYWIVVDGTCSATAGPTYWSTVGTVLQQVTETIPSYVHVGLLVATSEDLVIYDLNSPVPHARHAAWPLPDYVSLPLSPAYSFHLPAALRALADTPNIKENANTSGMPLGATLEAILDTLQQHTHPGNHASLHGQYADGESLNGASAATARSRTTPTHIPSYAGGRILCLLSGPPVEIGRLPRHEVMMKMAEGDEPKTSHGTGGFGGNCAEFGKRYSYNQRESMMPPEDGAHDADDEDDPELGKSGRRVHEDGSPANRHPTNNDDMTPENLHAHYPSTSMEHVEVYFHELGVACAEAAMGVDLLVLTMDEDETSQSEDIGLPLLRGLADRSGAPGPLLLSFDSPETIGLFQREILSRTPWYRPGGFGALLRLRLSPGFHVDTTPVEPLPEDKGPQLAPLYSSGGCMGPATALDEEGLWMMGALDDTTTVSVDLRIDDGVIKDYVHIDGLGDVPLPPGMQLCVAYSTVEQNSDGSWATVRKMRVTSLGMPLAHDTETLYSALDPETLAVVLFHKLSIASLDDGLLGTQDIGQSWLKSLLVCAYRSAEREEQQRAADAEHGLPVSSLPFFPQERLLNRQGGESTSEEVLLGQGHELLRPIPLAVFSLLQCDALRPSCGSFRPSMDARSAALAQMYSMSPSDLARCIAPRLELWNDTSDEPVLENVELSLSTIKFVVGEESQATCALFLDSPREVLVVHGGCVVSNTGKSKFTIGDGLKRSIELAIESYRVPPPVVYELESNDHSRSTTVLMDSLLEDSYTSDGTSFVDWKCKVAAKVQG